MWYWDVRCGTGVVLLPGGAPKVTPASASVRSGLNIQQILLFPVVFLAFTASTNPWRNSLLSFRYVLPGTQHPPKPLTTPSNPTGSVQTSWLAGRKGQTPTVHASDCQLGVPRLTALRPYLQYVRWSTRQQPASPSLAGALSSIRPWCFFCFFFCFQLVANWCVCVLAAVPAVH